MVCFHTHKPPVGLCVAESDGGLTQLTPTRLQIRGFYHMQWVYLSGIINILCFYLLYFVFQDFLRSICGHKNKQHAGGINLHLVAGIFGMQRHGAALSVILNHTISSFNSKSGTGQVQNMVRPPQALFNGIYYTTSRQAFHLLYVGFFGSFLFRPQSVCLPLLQVLNRRPPPALHPRGYILPAWVPCIQRREAAAENCLFLKYIFRKGLIQKTESHCAA